MMVVQKAILRSGFWAGLFFIGVGATAIALASPAAGSRPAANVYCPVLTEEKADPAITITYQGKTIAFCCEKCRAKFQNNPQRYAAQLAQVLAMAAETQSPSAGGGLQHRGQPRPGTRPAHNADETDEHAEDHGHDAAAGQEGPPHDHAEQHGNKAGAGKLIAWLGKFHPPMVNFPIAMLVGAAVAELLLIATRRPLFESAGRFCVWFGALGAVAAAVLGWFFAGFHLSDQSWLMTAHRWLGTGTALWAICVLGLGIHAHRKQDPKSRTRYRTALFAGAALVSATGFLGGSLVYGINHYAW